MGMDFDYFLSCLSVLESFFDSEKCHDSFCVCLDGSVLDADFTSCHDVIEVLRRNYIFLKSEADSN